MRRYTSLKRSPALVGQFDFAGEIVVEDTWAETEFPLRLFPILGSLASYDPGFGKPSEDEAV